MRQSFNFTRNEVLKLLTMQDELNSYIHPEWKIQYFDWKTALVDECQELLGHLGWKWWKKDYKIGLTDANRKQVQLEVIDMLHFMLSKEMDGGSSAEDVASYVMNKLNWLPYQQSAFNVADETVNLRDNYSEDLRQWVLVALSVGLDEVMILETYAQKFVLNKFRQDHGYKDGSYVKVWTLDLVEGAKSLEDNEVLELLVTFWKFNGQDTTDEIELYKALELKYNSRLNK